MPYVYSYIKSLFAGLKLDYISIIIYVKKGEKIMEKYICTVCQYVYDPEENDNVKFEDLPDDYTCPLCNVGKDMFEKE